ncbi:Lin1244/Lin1753 domain-containing protein [Veillonella parvula]
MAKLTNYFSHDVSALSDPKIMIMISLHGMVSYAWWWILIERLAVEEDCKLPYNKFTFAGLAIAFQISDNLAFWKQNIANAKQNVANIASANLPDLVEKFIQSLIEDCNLLDTDGTYFWSPSLQRRTAERLAKTNAILEKRREAGRLGGLAKASKYLANAKQNIANASDGHSKNSSKLANLPKEKKEKKDIIFYSTNEHDEVKQNEANASDDIDINDLFEKSDTKLNDTQSKVYKVYMSEIGEISSVTKERIDDLVVDFGANEVVNAISIASERGKGSIGYITAILNNKVKEEVIKGNGSNGRSSGNRKNKAATDSSEVDWDKETGEWI